MHRNLTAAANGLGVSRLVLHEPSHGPDEDSKRAAHQLAEDVKAALAEDRGRTEDAGEVSEARGRTEDAGLLTLRSPLAIL